jgi:peptidoglycan/xylan/chitin deacetylase (PgdA/CDA1 family)
VAHHHSVKKVIPEMLRLLKKCDIAATYFVESWNIGIHRDFILDSIVSAGHGVGWHAWQHEPWSKMQNEGKERSNFERSFGAQGLGQGLDQRRMRPYHGFRSPEASLRTTL